MTAIARVVLRLGVTAFLFLFPLSLLAAESVRFKPGVWTESRQPGEQVVKGALFLPSGAPPYPAVVLLPHCGGFKSTNVQRVWPDFLTDSGYAVLTVDS